MDALALPPSLRELYTSRTAEPGFEPDAAQLAAVTKLDDLRARLATRSEEPKSLWRRKRRNPPERGLYMWGEVGRGKTWLMDLFVESLAGVPVRRRHFHRFMHDAHTALKALRRHVDPLDLAAAQLARDTRVLCFDELSVQDIADAMILGGLLKGLLNRGVTLVATSNVRPSDLYQGGLQRERFLPAIELIERHTEPFEVAGPTDYRLRRLSNAGVYLPANAPNTPRQLQALFEQLAGRSDASGSLEIDGRSITVVRRGLDAVWFEFTALCATARSARDYIEIAREFTTVVVTDVPVLDSLKDAQTRRFITLVDELYDHNVKLIVSAAAEPAELYRGERLAADFRRTASRLVEMQSESYLAREHRP